MVVPNRLNVLISGASGFIGSRLVKCLREQHVLVTALVRPERQDNLAPRFNGTNKIRLLPGDLTDPQSLQGSCVEINTVFHLAGYAHADDVDKPDADCWHWKVTVEGTRALINEAVRAGVKRFVFVSSAKAMGEGTVDCLDESSPARPESTYGRAKLEAERIVLAAGREHGLHVSILRLPLVYGPGNKGNLPKMIDAIGRGRFPTLPEVHNKRSMVHVDDVVQALLLAAARPDAMCKTYIITDGKVYSTREIYTLICQALGRPISKWTLPSVVLKAAASLGDGLGRLGLRAPLNSEVIEKLLGSAWYSSEKISRELGYRPTRTLADALPEMVEYYRKEVDSD